MTLLWGCGNTLTSLTLVSVDLLEDGVSVALREDKFVELRQ